jgi:hypothetical protein
MDLAELYHLIIDAHNRDGEGELKELLCLTKRLTIPYLQHLSSGQ